MYTVIILSVAETKSIRRDYYENDKNDDSYYDGSGADFHVFSML